MTAEKPSCISFYLANGYVLTPLNGKIPLVRKWQNATYDPIFDTDANYGVVLQDDDLVVDIDPRNGGKIPPFLQNVQTFIVKTGGGGWHYYFKKPSDVSVVGLLKDYPGVEYKTKGQQVVGAGSRTDNIYQVINPHPVVKAPKELLSLITRRAEVLKSAKTIEHDDSQATQDRFLQYLSNCPVATEGQSGDKTTFVVACHGRDLGLSEQKTLELMVINYNPRCLPPWAVEEVNIKVNNAYKYAANDAGVLNPKADFEALEKEIGVSGWEHDKAGKLKKTFRNTLNVLLLPNSEIAGLFHFNEFSEDIEFTRESPWHRSAKDSKMWTDTDAVMLKEWITVNYRFEPDVTLIHEAVLVIAKRKSYHPVRDYLQKIKWDGKERIGNWLNTYLKIEESEYTRTIGKIVLCAAVRRIFNPGEKFDYLMVLEGQQRIGKSRVCMALGGDYHIGLRLDPHNKDMIDYMRSKWIVEIEEMDFPTKAETNAIKAFLSRKTDRVRPAYARISKDFPRQCIFIGTYNPIDGESLYLKDPTGNTRFWPVSLPDGKIDVDRILSDRDQIWAEAVVKARDCKLYLEPELEKTLAGIQHVKQELDPWHDLVHSWLISNVAKGKSITGLTVYTQCIGGTQKDYHASEGRRIGHIFRHIGWPKVGIWNKEKEYMEKGHRRPDDKKSIDNDIFA